MSVGKFKSEARAAGYVQGGEEWEMDVDIQKDYEHPGVNAKSNYRR